MHFTFVSGDIGGARTHVPVIKLLNSLGIQVAAVTDSAGLAYTVFEQEKIPVTFADPAVMQADFIKGSDLLFVSSCGSASGMGIRCAGLAYGKVPVVIGADSLFSHGFQKWLDVEADVWFAINRDHADAIAKLRPALPSKAVRVVGQPSWDSLVDLVPCKDAIRLQRRSEFGLSDSHILAVWWSQGMPEVIEEDILMMKAMLEAFSEYGPRAAFVPRIHPKLNSLKAGYQAAILSDIQSICAELEIRLIDGRSVSGEELNLAADVIFAVTCTEDIKNSILGGPPVIHFAGPQVREWFERDLNLAYPYLPDVASGQSLIVHEASSLPGAMSQALSLRFNEERLRHWQAPTERATDTIVRELIAIASR